MLLLLVVFVTCRASYVSALCGFVSQQVVHYLLGISSSSHESDFAESDSVESSSDESDLVESDSDDEAVPGLWAHPKKHIERTPTL